MINSNISIVLNTFTYTHPVVKTVAILFAVYIQYIIAIALIVFIFKNKKQIKENTLIVMRAVLSALVARFIIKSIIVLFFHIPRPYVALSQIHLMLAPNTAGNYQSFPSGHALFFFAIGYMIYLYDKRWGYFFLILAVLMGVARVMVGMHYPLDILGGALIGMLVSFCIYKISQS